MKAKRVTMTFVASRNSTVDGRYMCTQQHVDWEMRQTVKCMHQVGELQELLHALYPSASCLSNIHRQVRELQICALTQSESTCSLSDHPSTKNTKGGIQTSLSRKQQPRGSAQNTTLCSR